MIKCGYFVSEFQGQYIAGYKTYNGKRWIYHYIKSVYNGNYIFNLDYTHAKHMTYKTAVKHMGKMHELEVGVE